MEGTLRPRCPTTRRLIGAQRPLPRSLDFACVAQTPPGFRDKNIFERRLGQRDGIDLAGERLQQARDESGTIRMLDPHFIVQDADFYFESAGDPFA